MHKPPVRRIRLQRAGDFSREAVRWRRQEGRGKVMSLLGRSRESRSEEMEHQLEDLYAETHHNLFGTPPAEARRMIRDVISKCKKQGIEEGTADLSENLGDILIAQAEEGTPAALRIVGKARNEGARDQDIAEWWNLHDLQRRMVVWSEEVFRYANFRSFLEQGLDADEAMRRVRRIFPMYGDPRDTTHVTGEDRPLPHDLRGRVDAYREKYGAEATQGWSGGYSTFNAFVRAEIGRGKL